MIRFDHYVLDEAGEPKVVDLLVWAEWFEHAHDERVVLQTAISRRGRRVIEWPLHLRGHGIGISTVFLGLDHNWNEDGPPVLWESMIFGGLLNGECRRYTSKLDALTGHAALVERARAAAHVPRRLKKALTKRQRQWDAPLGPRERRAVERFERRAA